MESETGLIGSTTETVAPTTGIKLSSELKQNFSERSLYLTMTPEGRTEIVFSGVWNGTLLKGAIRNIEREYSRFKVSARRSSISEHFNQLKKEATP